MKAMSLISDPFWSISIKNIMNINNILSWYRFQCHLTIIPSTTEEINNYQTIFRDIQIKQRSQLAIQSSCLAHLQVLSHLQLFATPWAVVCQVPLSMEFSRQEYCNGLPFSTPGILLTQGLNPHLSLLLNWQVDSLPLESTDKPIAHLILQYWPWEGLLLPENLLSFCRA